MKTTYHAFVGTPEEFLKFRQAVTWATGGSYPPHEYIENGRRIPDDVYYVESRYAGILPLLNIHGNYGHVKSNELTGLISVLEKTLSDVDRFPGGNILKGKKNSRVVKDFILGCKAAEFNDDAVEFSS